MIQRDALLALRACTKRYGPLTINLYSITLWDAVKFEILNAQEEDLADDALRVLYGIGRQLSTSTHEGPLQNYLKPICKECNEHLEDTPTKQSSASGRILGAVAESSSESASILVKAVFPQLLRFCQSADNIPRRRGLLEVIIKLVQAHAAVFGHWRRQDATFGQYRIEDDKPDLSSSPVVLVESRDRALDVLLRAVETTPANEVSFRLLALDGLQSLALVRGLLDSSSIVRIVRLLTTLIINEAPQGRDEVKAKSIDVLVNIARQKPQLIMENVVPVFVAELPDTDARIQKSYVPILEAFAKLSAESQIFQTIILRLKNRLHAALRNDASVKYTTSILSAMLYAFSNDASRPTSSESLAPYYSEIVMPLLKDIIAGGTKNFPGSTCVLDETIFDLIGRICNSILRGQPFPAQTEVCRNIYVLFRDTEPTNLPPFHESDMEQNLQMITSTHLLAALHQQLTPHDNLPTLLTALVNYATKPTLSLAVIASVSAQVSLLVNKYIASPTVKEVVLPLLWDTSPLLSTENTGPVNICVAFAMVKALVFRADPSVASLLPNLIQHFRHPTHGKLAAQSFAALIAPDAYISRENHCKIYGIYRQRFFSLAAPLLVSSYRVAAASGSAVEGQHEKENYLVALSGVVQHVPYEILQSQLEELAPLLLQSLTLNQPDVRASAITTISKVIIYDPKILEQHVASVISRLLDVAVPSASVDMDSTAPAPKYAQLAAPIKTTSQSSPSLPKIRAAALACLASLVGSLQDETLVPYQRQTVRTLASSLDDPKRAVRAEGVRCRAAWLGLAAADDDDDDF